MKRSSFYFRFYALAAIIIVLFGVLVVRLWVVQILQGTEYAAKIENRSQVTVRLPAVRGEILDRNGVKLVENRACYEVDFYLPAMVKAYRDKHEGKMPTTQYRGRVRGMLRMKKAADMETIIRDDVIPRLEKLGLAQDYNSQRLQTHFQDSAEIPFSYRQNIDYDTMVRYMENNVGLPGLEIAIKPMRHYIYGSLAAHMLGYVGAPLDHDPQEVAKYNYFQPDVVGKSQVELFYDSYLRGTAGAKILDRDVKGVIRGELKRIEPRQGANVYLTIDARLQFIVEQTLRNVGRASAVVMDPNNGDILAMASVPAFDPNTFIPSISAADWAALQKNPANPLVNRAISAYAPGSTYKIPISLAGLRAGIGSRTFSCSGGVQYGNFYMKCWLKTGHGTLRLEEAIKVSCNSFFYQYGNAAGINQIVAVGNMLGLGQKSGLPLSGEVPGILPGPEWLAQNYPRERWSSGYTANAAIGQGFVLVSPLQMAVVASAVANGGTAYYPRLVEKVVSQDGQVLLQEPARVRADLKTDAGMK
ncbi:MAG TPA: penicillin-binding transpeptidase domain-containing protein, partial [Chthoniobacterales bacterium]